MRRKMEPQATIHFQSSNLKLTTEYYAKYEKMSKILDHHPEILDLAHRDLSAPLCKAAKGAKKGGRGCTYTTDNLLRIHLCQVIEGLSLRGIVVRIDDSTYLRHFVGLEERPMMDFTTLCNLKNAIRPETWKVINDRLAAIAVREELIGGEKLRLDTTAVETSIHWPTDSSLLWDVYRVLARLLEQAREIDPTAVGNKRLHKRLVKRLQMKIARKASKKGKSATTLEPLYERLIGQVEGIRDWAGSVAQRLKSRGANRPASVLDHALRNSLVEQIDHYCALAETVVGQARRRVLEKEQVPNEEKIFSIFEEHTELLKRGKAGKNIEFGHMIQIQQVQEKFITGYEVFGHKPVEHQLLRPALESHRRLFGNDPDQLSADKGYYESMDVIRELEKSVPMVSIAKKGMRTEEETAREHDPLFRHAQRFRAGVEGTISFLKRVLQLARCLNKGWKHFEATVGATIFAHNLLILARC